MRCSCWTGSGFHLSWSRSSNTRGSNHLWAILKLWEVLRNHLCHSVWLPFWCSPWSRICLSARIRPHYRSSRAGHHQRNWLSPSPYSIAEVTKMQDASGYAYLSLAYRWEEHDRGLIVIFLLHVLSDWAHIWTRSSAYLCQEHAYRANSTVTGTAAQLLWIVPRYRGW